MNDDKLAAALRELLDSKAAYDKVARFAITPEMAKRLVEAEFAGRQALATYEAEKQDGGTLEDNVRYLLDRCPYTVRCREGGGPENLISSLCITFTGMQMRLERDPMFAPKKPDAVVLETFTGAGTYARIDRRLEAGTGLYLAPVQAQPVEAERTNAQEAPQVQPAREPMSPEQARKLWMEAAEHSAIGQRAAEYLIRAVERYHRIGSKGGQS